MEILSLLLKGVGLAAFALVATALMGRRSAAARHLVCALCLTGLLLLPLLSLGLPAWHVVPLPVRSLPSSVETSSVPVVPEMVAEKVASAPATVTTPVLPPPPVAIPAPLPSPLAPAAAPVSAPVPTVWPALLLGVYLAGMLLAVGSLLRDLLAARRLIHACNPVTGDGFLADLFEANTRRMGVRRPVTLRCGEEVAVPMTAGWLRPVVLLPHGARGWDAEGLGVAFLHEAAHVRRGDFAWQIVGRAACALHWCNPLAWLLARRMREEAERACDDRVLAAGVAASEYADRLVKVASRLTRPGSAFPAAAAVPMARQSDLGRRLGALLAAHGDRSPLSPGRALLLAATIAVCLLPLAALRARQTSAVPSPVTETAVVKTAVAKTAALLPSDVTPSFRHTLTDGTVVELVSVARARIQNASSETLPWWHPDGAPDVGPLPYRQESHVGSSVYGEENWEFLVRVTGPGSEDRERTWKTVTASSGGGLSTGISLPNGKYSPELSLVNFYLPKGGSAATFQFGVAAAKWERSSIEAPMSLASSTGGTTAAGHRVNAVMFGRPIVTRIDPYNAGNTPQLGTFRHVSYSAIPDEEIRWVADTQAGRVVPALKMGRMGSDNQVSEDLFFPGLRIEQITRIRLESRPYEWVTFQEIALQPAQTTTTSAAALPGSAEQTRAMAARHFAPGTIRFPNGVLAQGFYVEGVQPDGSMAAWDKDGRLLLRVPYRSAFQLKTGEIRFNVERLQLPGLPDTLDSVTYKRLRSNHEIETEFGVVGETLLRAIGPSATGIGNDLFCFTESFVWNPAPGAVGADVYLTTGYGPWQTLGTSDHDQATRMTVPGGGAVSLSPFQAKRHGVETEILATVPARFVSTDTNGRPLWRLRMEPVDAAGRALGNARIVQYDEKSDDAETGRLRFRFLTSDLPAQAKSVRLLARPLQTVYFSNVPTRPTHE